MQTTYNTYRVTVIKKIPYITEFFYFLLLPGLIVLIIAYFFLLPSVQSSNEMEIIAIFTLIPEHVQFICLYFVGTTIVLFPFYKYAKIYKRGVLVFNDQLLLVKIFYQRQFS